MSCERMEENLVALLDDELTAEVREATLRHVAACPACSAEVAGLRGLHAALAQALGGVPGRSGPASFAHLSARLDALDATAAGEGDRLRAGGRPAVARRAALGGVRDGRVQRGGDAGRARPRAGSGRRFGALAAGLAVAGLAIAVAVARDPASRSPQAPVEIAAPAPQAAGGAQRQGGGATSAVASAPVESREPSRERARRPVDPAPPEGDVAPVAAGGDAAGRDLQVPEDLRRHPDMFLDFPIVQRLEKLRHMEAIYRDSQDPSGEGSG